MKKKHVMPLLLGAGVLYYLYNKSHAPAVATVATAPVIPPVGVAGFGYRR